jgi:hypothetical protein
MARNVWAKVWCDILRHPVFARRPDCDKVLGVGLILYAKEYFPDDGVVRGLDAEEMRRAFRISAPTAKVQEGLEYLLRCGWLRFVDDRGSFVIKDFVARQKHRDTPEAQRERAKRYYEQHKDEVLQKRKFSRQSHDSSDDILTAGITEVSPTRSHAESEAESESPDDRSSQDGESEGKDSTACESGDSVPAPPENLSDSDKSQARRLLAQGKATAVLELLAQNQERKRRAP